MDVRPLPGLLDTAATAVVHDISVRGYTRAHWPTEQEVAALCGSLADTSSAERSLFRAELRHRQRVALGRFGVRCATVALRERSPALLRIGLITIALAEADGDPRDLMVTVAAHHHVARELGLAPAEIFDEAGSYADPDTADVLRVFGRRTDVTLQAFGRRLVDTPEGPQIV
jgi:hypothetical protein